MATVVVGSSDVAGLGTLLGVPPFEVGNGSDVEVDAVAARVPAAPGRAIDQIPAAAPSATAMVIISAPGRFHHGRLRLCMPRMATTLVEEAAPAADASGAQVDRTLQRVDKGPRQPEVTAIMEVVRTGEAPSAWISVVGTISSLLRLASMPGHNATTPRTEIRGASV